jgi:hypothetical protein
MRHRVVSALYFSEERARLRVRIIAVAGGEHGLRRLAGTRSAQEQKSDREGTVEHA